MAACRSWHQLEQEMPDPVEIRALERGDFPNVSVSRLFLTCFHCGKPSCVPACPCGVLVKRAEDGIVIMTNLEDCTGCELCVQACPYSAPKIVAGDKARIIKCNLCVDRISEGRGPACVDACPTEAIGFGPMDELIAIHGRLREIEGFVDHRETNPSIIFRSLIPRRGDLL